MRRTQKIFIALSQDEVDRLDVLRGRETASGYIREQLFGSTSEEVRNLISTLLKAGIIEKRSGKYYLKYDNGKDKLGYYGIDRLLEVFKRKQYPDTQIRAAIEEITKAVLDGPMWRGENGNNAIKGKRERFR